jgi:membrane-associated phospholipid phosphatase
MRSSARLPLLAALGCAAAFVVVLVCAYAVGPIERLDATALHGLGSIEGSLTIRLSDLAAHLADPLPVLVALAGLFGWGWAVGRRRQAVAMVAAASVASQVLKVALAHPRIQPAFGPWPYQLGAEAFPSGHATAAMSLGLAAVLVASARARVAAASLAAAYVAAVSTAVLILGWHYPSDVVGGLLLSSTFFFCAVAAIRHLGDREGRVEASPAPLRRPRRLGEVALVAAVGIGLVALVAVVEASHLASFAEAHTTAAATAVAIMATAGALLAGATMITDDQL